jgi:low molecular weight protein-tyrosine phosphatase
MTERPVRILFVCLGNICRSPTAEGVMRAQVADAGLSERFEIDSAGTGGWHVGHPPDERATAAAARRGISLDGAARRVTPADLATFDHVIAMDSENLADLQRMASGEQHEAVLTLLRSHDETASERGELDVPDPYFGGEHGFEHVLDVVEAGCRGLLRAITRQHMIGSDGNS